jgi:hypothetical protein
MQKSHDIVPLNFGFLGMRRRRQKTYPKKKKRRKKMTPKDAKEYDARDDAGDDAGDDACKVEKNCPRNQD